MIIIIGSYEIRYRMLIDIYLKRLTLVFLVDIWILLKINYLLFVCGIKTYHF